MRLDGSTFIVTGGGSGLGCATARRLHACGARVLVADNDAGSGQSLAAELGAKASFCRTDVTSEAEARGAVQQALERFGALDGLINCAGTGATRAGSGEDAARDLALFARIVGVSIVGTFNMIRLAAGAMTRTARNGTGGAGVIINTISPALLDGQVGNAGHAAARGGIVAMTLAIARELAASRIRLITVAPARSHAVMEFIAGKAPFLKCLGTPEAYAAFVQRVIEKEAPGGEGVPLEGLSQREIEVLHLVAQGKTNKEIGMILGISSRTAQVHISHIYAKIGVGNRASAVLWLTERQTLLRGFDAPSLAAAV